MAGHSHAANVARRKNAVDAKRGKIFSKCARLIISAARQGGGDPQKNLKLRYAIDAAKAENMPKDSIERAVAKGSGSKDGDDFEELMYEGYGPGGVAMMVSCLTDNRNRTAPDLKHIFEKRGGNMGATGSVSFMFDSKAVFVVERGDRDEDSLTEIALEGGADDVEVDGEYAVFTGAPSEFAGIKDALDGAGLVCTSAKLSYVPQNTVEVESAEMAKKILRLVEDLEDNDDVQDVFANYDMPDEWMD